MKKAISLILCTVLILGLLAGCTTHVTKTETHSTTENGVTTTTTTTTETVNGKTTTDTTTTTTTEGAAPEDNMTFAEAAADGEAHIATLAIHNTSENGAIIAEFYYAPTGTEDWSDNFLKGPMEQGYYNDSNTIEYDAEHLVFDFLLIDGDGTQILFDEIDLSNAPSTYLDLFFTYKGDGVWNIRG